MDNTVNVTLDEFQGRILSGRERGVDARNLKKLDDLDAQNTKVRVFFPAGLWSVTSSFFLGMFGPSIIKCGSKTAFKDKFSFETKDSIAGMIDGYIDFALQSRDLI